MSRGTLGFICGGDTHRHFSMSEHVDCCRTSHDHRQSELHGIEENVCPAIDLCVLILDVNVFTASH